MKPRCTKRGVTYHVLPAHLSRRSPAGRSYPNPSRVALGVIPQCSKRVCMVSNGIKCSSSVGQQRLAIKQPEPDSCTQSQRESKGTFESPGVGWTPRFDMQDGCLPTRGSFTANQIPAFPLIVGASCPVRYQKRVGSPLGHRNGHSSESLHDFRLSTGSPTSVAEFIRPHVITQKEVVSP